MTTVADIVTLAYREGNIIPVGTTPSAAEQVEGIGSFNRYLNSVYGFILGENLSDWQVPYNQRTGEGVDALPPFLPSGGTPLIVLNNQYPAANRRIVWDGSGQTVYFPQRPDDGARMSFVKSSGVGAANVGVLTLDGNGRTIEGAATYTSNGVSVKSRAWLYRADTADWHALVSLAAGDEVPFPPEFDDLWITATAIRLAPRFGKTVSAETLSTNKRMAVTLKSHYTQYVVQDSGGDEIMSSYQSYNNTWRNDLV